MSPTAIPYRSLIPTTLGNDHRHRCRLRARRERPADGRATGKRDEFADKGHIPWDVMKKLADAWLPQPRILHP